MSCLNITLKWHLWLHTYFYKSVLLHTLHWLCLLCYSCHVQHSFRNKETGWNLTAVIFEGLLREVIVKFIVLWVVTPCSWKLSIKLHDVNFRRQQSSWKMLIPVIQNVQKHKLLFLWSDFYLWPAFCVICW